MCRDFGRSSSRRKQSTRGQGGGVYLGEWGTVCDDYWDIDDAIVVCRQLGFLGIANSKVEAFFGEGTGDIVLDDVQCVGTETNLGQCPLILVDHNCGHGEDAGVICTDPAEEGTRPEHGTPEHFGVTCLALYGF